MVTDYRLMFLKILATMIILEVIPLALLIVVVLVEEVSVIEDLEEVIDMVVDVVDMVHIITIMAMDVVEVLIMTLGTNNLMGPCHHPLNNNLMARYRHHHRHRHHDNHILMVNHIMGTSNLPMVRLCNNRLSISGILLFNLHKTQPTIYYKDSTRHKFKV